MAKIYMITAKRIDTAKEWMIIQRWIRKHDVHKWLIGAETGQGGYNHWQIRLKCSLTWEQMQTEWIGCHIEEASDTWEYESKSKYHWSSEDTPEVRQQRFGKPRWYQYYIIERLKQLNDRQILVWYDETGNVGKSWLCGHLHETNQGYYVPPTMESAQKIIQWVASGYRMEPIIVIDIPRTAKWTKELYIAIEAIKDGLVYDTRYNARIRNIKGVQVLILTNTMPNLDKLSEDRWVIETSEWMQRRGFHVILTPLLYPFRGIGGGVPPPLGANPPSLGRLRADDRRIRPPPIRD